MIHISKIAAACDLAYTNSSVDSDTGLNSALFTYYKEPDTGKTWYIVAFRGTDTLDDWVMNNLILMKKKVTNPYAEEEGKKILYNSQPYAHYGFYFAYLSLRNDVLAHLDGKDNVIYTGHSMGGALAALCALDMKYRHPNKNIRLVTFGAPRLGNYSLMNRFEKVLGKQNCTRVVKLLDPVPHTPLFGYAHFPAQVVWIWGWNPIVAHHMPDYYKESKTLKLMLT